jgi:hypothetical protein
MVSDGVAELIGLPGELLPLNVMDNLDILGAVKPIQLEKRTISSDN